MVHDAGNAAVLSGTPALLLMRIVEIDFLGNGLAIGDLRHAGIDLDVVFAAHAFRYRFRDAFSHTADNRFLGFRVDKRAERRIFLGTAV